MMYIYIDIYIFTCNPSPELTRFEGNPVSHLHQSLASCRGEASRNMQKRFMSCADGKWDSDLGMPYTLQGTNVFHLGKFGTSSTQICLIKGIPVNFRVRVTGFSPPCFDQF